MKKTTEIGQGLISYALILVLIAIVVIGSLTFFGETTEGFYSYAVTQLSGVGSTTSTPDPSSPPPECYGSLLIPLFLMLSVVVFYFHESSVGKNEIKVIDNKELS